VHLGALPGGRRVAAITLAAVLPEVHVVLLVTRQAVLLELHLIRWAAVARLAGELAVCAAERKPGLLAVVELPQLPAVLRVAAVAVLAEVALVHIILLVAVDALVADLAILAGEVTLLARHCHVQTDQREFRQVVIEAHARAPALRRVALIALLAEAAGVHIVRPMAAHALGRQLLRHHVRRVAGVAGDLLVLPGEGPRGVARVVEARRLPFLAAVADAAVLVAQRKACLVVVVADVPPGALVVAGAAVAPQLALVRLLFSMTGDAFLLRIAKGLAGGVTALAHHVDVRAAQRIVGVLVIELLVAQLHDVGGAAEMLGVAGAALRDVDAGEAAVEVAVLVQIAGDLLVTVETQLRLLAAVAAVVAERARFLVFHVSRAQLARHEKRLRIHGLSVPPCQQSRQPSEYQQRVASSLPHGWRWSASIDVDGNHMNDRRDDHHEDQRYVQRMPQ